MKSLLDGFAVGYSSQSYVVYRQMELRYRTENWICWAIEITWDSYWAYELRCSVM